MLPMAVHVRMFVLDQGMQGATCRHTISAHHGMLKKAEWALMAGQLIARTQPA